MPDQAPSHAALRGRFAQVFRCLKMKTGTSWDLKWMWTRLFLSTSKNSFGLCNRQWHKRQLCHSAAPTLGCVLMSSHPVGTKWENVSVAHIQQSSSFTISAGGDQRATAPVKQKPLRMHVAHTDISYSRYFTHRITEWFLLEGTL